MDASTVLDAVREACATELDRLRSDKALIALTEAELETERVLVEAARAELRAHETFGAWADDEPHDAAREAFEAVAETEREHADRILENLHDEDAADAVSDPGPDPDALHEYLRGLDDSAERVGAGLVGRPLVASASLLQCINFFENEADPTTANLFRDLRSDTDDLPDRGVALLETVCETDDDLERARDAATGAVETAYREYVDSLEGMGIDPKPVC